MSSVIFIGNIGYEKERKGWWLGRHVRDVAADVPRRVALSFVPPVSAASRKVHVDLVGPCVAVSLLALLLHAGHAAKHPGAALRLAPSVALLLYCLLTPLVCYIITCLGGATLSLLHLSSLLGYGLYGHLLTIFTSSLFPDEASVFLVSLGLFAGLSSLRIILVLLVTIPRPAARLIVCSFILLVHLLFLIFIHYSYMHYSFSYGKSMPL